MKALRVACAMSGGVDSTVAAALLKQRGHSVTGVFMKNWELADELDYCRADLDCADAKMVCDRLKIDFVQLNFVREYWLDVFQPFLRDYESGLTPNPDVLCNRYIKFGVLYRRIRELGFDALATGHYAGSNCLTDDGLDFLPFPPDGAQLLTAADQSKDQTYFLARIEQNPLRRTLFPLMNWLKSDVKRLAGEFGFRRIVSKRESVGICFVGKRNFKEFITEYLPPRPGQFVRFEARNKSQLDKSDILGVHNGIHNYTIGQRSGLHLDQAAYFIESKCPRTQRLYVVSGWFHPSLFSRFLVLSHLHFICPSSLPLDVFNSRSQQAVDIKALGSDLVLSQPYRCYFKFQHVHFKKVPCSVRRILSPPSDLYFVELDQPLRALTPGQYGVLYGGDESRSQCLGSGVISSVGPTLFDQGFSTVDELLDKMPVLKLYKNVFC